MNPTWPMTESWENASERDSHPPTEITLWSQKLGMAINKRVAHESGELLNPSFEDAFEQQFFGLSEQIEEMTYLGSGSIHFRDRFGSDFLAEIVSEDGKYFLTVAQVVLIFRGGAIDEPKDKAFATRRNFGVYPGSSPIRETVDGPIEKAFEKLLAMLDELIDQSDEMSRKHLSYRSTMRHLFFVDAGTLSYTSGIFGAALFMAKSIGPGWLGFLASYLPMSILTVWAASAHE